MSRNFPQAKTWPEVYVFRACFPFSHFKHFGQEWGHPQENQESFLFARSSSCLRKSSRGKRPKFMQA